MQLIWFETGRSRQCRTPAKFAVRELSFSPRATSLVRMKRPAPDSQFVGYAVNRVETQRRATSERSRFMKRVRFVGLDVHAETIAVAVAETDGEVRSLGVIP